MKSNSIKIKPMLLLGGCLILICLVIGLGIILFALWGGGGEPASLIVTTRVSQEFVEDIHNGQIEAAHSMLSEKFSPSVTTEQFVELIREDEIIFKTYQKLEICDWGFYISDGRVIDASGLLYYQDGVIAFQISLHKDLDAIWRVQGFRFRSEIVPEPFGLCQ